ncbi:MAG: hypothetical protein FWE16_03425 [Firmicutes bacterium]|nr:hypothetical protein [Bacillota bacterium]
MVPFNPAQHGASIENYGMVRRAGFRFTMVGAVILAFSLGIFVWANFFGDSQNPWLEIYLPLILLAFGFIFTFIGAMRLSRAAYFEYRLGRLRQNGMVTRGTVKRFRHEFILFGANRRWWQTRQSLVEETGWYYNVTYTFEDMDGQLVTRSARIIDRVGPKNLQPNQQTVIDPNIPRVGMFVDVLFDDYSSTILRLIPPTANI